MQRDVQYTKSDTISSKPQQSTQLQYTVNTDDLPTQKG